MALRPQLRTEPKSLRSSAMADRPAPAACIWLTGRRGSGKRTVGSLTAESLRAEGRACAVLDATALDLHLARGPSDGGLESLAWLAALLSENGVLTIVTVDAARRVDRDRLRDQIPGFVEVLVDAPAEVCATRSGFVDSTYEAPIAADLRIPTHDRDARASSAQLVSYLESLRDE
jgi:adenylylsulfate kinase-like enzyme